jgi:integrase
LAEQSQHFLPETFSQLKPNEKQISAHSAQLQSSFSGDIAVDACALAAYADEAVASNFPESVLPPFSGLRLPADDDTIRPVTPTQRRGRSMSRRRGQRGYVEQKGNWWHLRYRSETSEGRPHKSQPICLAVGRGKKTKSEAERLGVEWLAQQGINTELYLARAISPTVAFREQSGIWLDWLQARNNKPIPPTSVPSIRSALKCWLLPVLGDLPLSEVDELALNGLVKKMVGKRSPKTITTYINLAKEVVESQRDGKGRRVPHPKWDNEAIDLPEVNKREQRRPKVNGEGISQIVGLSETMWERMLYILCPSGGMRIAEALALDIGKHLSAERTVVHVRGQVKGSKIVEYLKTNASHRDIDLCPEVVALLIEYIGHRTSGLLFPSETGVTPMSYSNVRARSLHPKLVKLNLYTPGAAFHMFRRFRSSVLVKKGCPEDLKKFWLAHENQDISADYAEQIREDVEWRQMKAKEIGVGFDLPPSVAPNVPKTHEEEKRIVWS